MDRTINPIVAILGVGSGLAKALARRFALSGYTVTFISRSLENLQVIQTALAEEGYRIFSFEADAKDSESVSGKILTSDIHERTIKIHKNV